MNKGEVWAQQRTKKPVGLRLSVITIYTLVQTNKQKTSLIYLIQKEENYVFSRHPA